MKLFVNYSHMISLLIANPDNPPFLTLMKEAHCKGKYEANEVYYNINNKEILKNCKKQIMYILLKEVGYPAQLAMDAQDKWEVNRQDYIEWLKNESINS